MKAMEVRILQTMNGNDEDYQVKFQKIDRMIEGLQSNGGVSKPKAGAGKLTKKGNDDIVDKVNALESDMHSVEMLLKRNE